MAFEWPLPPAGAPARAVVVDTNVALDLLVFADARVAPLRQALQDGRLHWIATAPMRDELEHVLAYPHLAARVAHCGLQPAQVLAAFDAQAEQQAVAPRAACVCKDADDQKFIDLAAAHAAVLLSKDKAVLALRRRLLAQHGAQVASALTSAPVLAAG
ncbi:putative toxin-antitoxin system toxin component, PIN family [Pulveribacter sp.]|uniref:putative toxin-antitoxin system toxin component, PIN family n=1 Tax=Pulveribacter sp. TaxID=2678893 RepID=UPI0028985E35|nr:putative toxin-antitoxin system toxin component, PIN family [Pulveribacter sp.]